MIEEIAKKVSDLYLKKSELSNKISILKNPDIIIEGISHRRKDNFSMYTPTMNVEFVDELKEFLLLKIEKQLKEVEEELTNINCQ